MLEEEYNNTHENVQWQGFRVETDEIFEQFMANEVRHRVEDEEGRNDLENHLLGLASTNFEVENIENLLNSVQNEERAWAIGEAFAEAILEQENNVTFPWNQKRDLRNENSNLTGADLVGFINDNGQTKLLFGEVKTSIENNYPPGVLTGEHGMINQLGRYHNNTTRQITLVTWLYHRCKNTEYQTDFDNACQHFIQNNNSGAYLMGVLIRLSITANEQDFINRGPALNNLISGCTKGHLQAFYINKTCEQFVETIGTNNAT
ncbi:hypothetical protein L5F64_01970 [Aliarcobacter butzleri]|nr:hypothetical protein [Aliarcobacter butzleri]